MRVHPGPRSGWNTEYELQVDPSEDDALLAVNTTTESIVENSVRAVSKLCERSQFLGDLGRCALQAKVESHDGVVDITVGCDEELCRGQDIFTAHTPATMAVRHADEDIASCLQWAERLSE